ncbi:ABC-2 family transporter protein [soil metagenome]
MRKYLRIYLASLQKQLQYRVNLLGWTLVNFIQTIVYVWIWLALIGDKTSINGFSKGDFIIYYLFMGMLWYIVGGNFYNAVGDGIKNGEINKSLLKPYNVIIEKFLNEQGWKTVSLIIMVPIYTVVIWYFRDLIHVEIGISDWLFLFLSLILGAILFALLDSIIGLTSFWFTDVWSTATLFEVLREIFGGTLAPLTLMPQWVQTIANFLPFKYIFYIPTQILTHKSTNPLFDVLFQFVFVILFLLIYKFVWKIGIKRYESIGG